MLNVTKKAGDKRRVVFSLPQDIACESASVVGDFNEWDTSRQPMKRAKEGLWEVALDLGPGRYEFRYLVNGSDWYNDDTASCCPNAFGSENNVLEL